MISRTLSTRIPNSSLTSWNVRYFPARASTCAAASSVLVAVGMFLSPGCFSNSHNDGPGMTAYVRLCVAGAFCAGEAYLHQQTFVFPVKAHDDPFGVPGASRLEIPSKDHCRD